MDNQSFEKPLQSDMEKLEIKIGEHRPAPGVIPMPEKELLKEVIKEIEPEADEEGVLPDYANSAPESEKEKIESLLKLAFSVGIGKANAEAKKSDPYIMDAFHDALTGKLHPQLKEKGIL